MINESLVNSVLRYRPYNRVKRARIYVIAHEKNAICKNSDLANDRDLILSLSLSLFPSRSFNLSLSLFASAISAVIGAAMSNRDADNRSCRGQSTFLRARVYILLYRLPQVTRGQYLEYSLTSANEGRTRLFGSFALFLLLSFTKASSIFSH